MEYKPHDYQQFAINYILEHSIAAVILGMGLGKTSITLTAIEQLIYDSFEVSKVLVVAPLRVARNTWSDEIHKWNHLKHLRYSIVLGSVAERKKALEADADIYIINRENLQWLIEQSGVNFFWDMVVLDELSSFKNWNSKRFKAFMKVRPNVKKQSLEREKSPRAFFVKGSEHMPYRSNIPCKHPGCAALIPHGQMYCEEHKPLHTKDRAHAAERGYGAKWQRERRKFLESNPFCVKCYEEGHITMATVVDHIKPHRGDQKLFWDRSNWQPLCEHHHNVKTMTEDRFKEYRF